MSAFEASASSNEWTAYYDRFPYFSHDTIRPGCHPVAMEHTPGPKKAIVLVHGLTDSPYFLSAIADHFYTNLGYNVYMPLLQGHGLKAPNGMEGIEMEEWKANVWFAVRTAAERVDRVSIGGLSTGGTLSFYMACTKPQIKGDLYLFSAALDLAGGPTGFIGEMKERLLRTFLSEVLDRNQPLIGPNPYRYSRIDMDGARELARLIKETDYLLKAFDSDNPFPKKVFAAHSESDVTAHLEGIHRLKKKTSSENFIFYAIPGDVHVMHASLVLKDPIFGKGEKGEQKLLEKANPQFADMMEAITRFQQDV